MNETKLSVRIADIEWLTMTDILKEKVTANTIVMSAEKLLIILWILKLLTALRERRVVMKIKIKKTQTVTQEQLIKM